MFLKTRLFQPKIVPTKNGAFPVPAADEVGGFGQLDALRQSFARQALEREFRFRQGGMEMGEAHSHEP